MQRKKTGILKTQDFEMIHAEMNSRGEWNKVAV